MTTILTTTGELNMQWKIAGLTIGVLTGILVILSVRMPLYFSVPVVVGLMLAGGRISEAIGSQRKS